MKIPGVNRSKPKYCVLHNGKTWNSVPDVSNVNVSFSMFKSKVRNLYLEKIFENIDAERHYDPIGIYIFFLTYCIYCFSSVIVLCFKYWTVKFPIVSFVIIGIVAEVQFLPVSGIVVKGIVDF